MTQTINFDNLMQMRGKPVYDSQHEKIGSVSEIFLDDATRQPEWVGIGSGGFFGSKHHLVPVKGASFESDGIMVPYTKDQVATRSRRSRNASSTRRTVSTTQRGLRRRG